MSTASTRNKAQSDLPKNWKKNDDIYTGNDLIDAYLKGKEDGKTDFVTIMLNQFNANLKNATTAAEQFMQSMVKVDIKVKSIHIKAEEITKFRALFVVDKKSFVSDEFNKIYSVARKTQSDLETETFSIFFTFMPASEHLSVHCLEADGFFARYEGK